MLVSTFSSIYNLITYLMRSNWAEKKGCYVVARYFFLALLSVSAWPCLRGPKIMNGRPEKLRPLGRQWGPQIQNSMGQCVINLPSRTQRHSLLRRREGGGRVIGKLFWILARAPRERECRTFAAVAPFPSLSLFQFWILFLLNSEDVSQSFSLGRKVHMHVIP